MDIEFFGVTREAGGNMVITIPKDVINYTGIDLKDGLILKIKGIIKKPDKKEVLKKKDESQKYKFDIS